MPGYANVSRPMGFIPYAPAGKRAGFVITRPVGATRHATTGGNASTDLAIGDAYAIDAATGLAYRAGTDTVRGIVIGIFFQASPLVMNGAGPVSTDYITGAVAQPSILGCEDAEAMFWVQADTFAITNVGSPFNLLDAAPDPNYRQSRQTINVGGGAGTQFRAMGLVNSPADNAFGANARIYVRLLTAFQD